MPEGAGFGESMFGTMRNPKGTPFDINDPNLKMVPNSLGFVLYGTANTSQTLNLWQFEVPLGHLYIIDNVRLCTVSDSGGEWEMRVCFGDNTFYGLDPTYGQNGALSMPVFIKYGSGRLDRDNAAASAHSGHVSAVTKEEPLYLYGGGKIELEVPSADAYADATIVYRDCFY